MNNKNNTGFSLLELMIILAITAMIVQFAVPSYQSHIKKAKQLETEVDELQESLKSFLETQK
jgi:Tfp pilus assembly protein FimT